MPLCNLVLRMRNCSGKRKVDLPLIFSLCEIHILERSKRLERIGKKIETDTYLSMYLSNLDLRYLESKIKGIILLIDKVAAVIFVK